LAHPDPSAANALRTLSASVSTACDHRLACTQFGRGQAQQNHGGRHQRVFTRVAPEFVDPLAILIQDPIAVRLVNQSLDHPQQLSAVLIDPARLSQPAIIRSPCSLAGRPTELLIGPIEAQ